MIIEDDDSFVQQEGLAPEAGDEEEQRGHALLLPLIIVIAWIAWTALCLVFFAPKIKTALEESGIMPLIADRSTETEEVRMRTVSLVYPLANGETVTVSLESPRYGSSEKHDTVEALISAYPEDAIAQGAVNLVPEDLVLNGLTSSGGICYVDVSHEIESAPSLGSYTAFDQIADTLLLFDDVEAVAFLVDGEEVVLD